MQESIGGITPQGPFVNTGGSQSHDELYLLTFTISGPRERWFGVNVHGPDRSIRPSTRIRSVLSDDSDIAWEELVDSVGLEPMSETPRAPTMLELFADPRTRLDPGAGTCISDVEVTLDPPR